MSEIPTNATPEQSAAFILYRFCTGVALFLLLFGIWNTLMGRHGRVIPILLFCLGIAITFYATGYWVHRMARNLRPD
jgi:hypothetical protein